MIDFLNLVKSSEDLQMLVFVVIIAFCITVYKTTKLFTKNKK